MTRARTLVAVAIAVALTRSLAFAAEPEGPAKLRPELVTQAGHTNDITAVAFSPDGKRALTGSADRTVRLWDVRSGREVRRFDVPAVSTYGVLAVAFSPNGHQLFTGSANITGRLWDADTGKEIRQFDGHNGYINSVAFSPDGKRVLTGSNDGKARVWDAETGKGLRELGHEREVFAVDYSSDGKWLLTGCGDGTARVWDADTGKELRRFRGGDDIRAAAFSSDSKQVITGTRGGVVQLWNARTGAALRKLPGHKHEVKSVRFSPDGKRVLTAGWEDAARVSETDTGKELYRLGGPAISVQVAIFSPDGKWVLTGGGDGIARVWDAESGKEVQSLGRSARLRAVAVSPDGSRVLTGWEDGTARVWDARIGRDVLRLQGHLNGVVSVAFSADGRRLLTGGENKDGSVRLWDARTGAELRRFDGSKGAVLALAFGSGGAWVLVGSGDGVRVWDAESGKEIRHLKLNKTADVVAFSADGTRAVTAGMDQYSIVWNVAIGKSLLYTDSPNDSIDLATLSADGKRLFTQTIPCRIRDVDTKRVVGQLEGSEKLTFPTFHAAAFSPDGKRILTGESLGVSRMWDVETGKELLQLNRQSGPIIATAFSPDRKRLLTGGGDNVVRLWEHDGREVCALLSTPEGTLAVTPDGYYMTPPGARTTVAFRVGGHTYPFEQFDLKFNRPDLVLERIGLAPKELITAYHKAYQKRLKSMDFTEDMLGTDFHVPRVTVASVPLTTTDRMLKLKVTATDDKYLLDRLLVSVNGVPIDGIGGLPLRDKKAKAWDGEVGGELSAGRNSVRVSVLNEKGAESLREVFDLTCTTPAPAPKVFAVVVGVSEYADARFKLDYAAKDANDIAAFLEKNGERFGEASVVRLTDKDATRANVLKARQTLLKAGPDDLVVVFLAGHGLLDKELDYYYATVDMDFSDPAKRGLGYADIEGLLDGLRCRRKLLLMDTCHSGEVDKEAASGGVGGVMKVAEGSVRARGFEVKAVRRQGVDASAQLSGQFADLRRGTGAVAIAAAGGMHHALESREWHNGVFTYALLSGLSSGKADRNKDGQVRVSELRDHVLDEVRRLTAGQQVPTVRRDNIDYDFPLDRPTTPKK